MKEALSVALIQCNLVWEDPAKNRAILTRKIDRLSDIDLIILPEMFNSGFTMNPNRVAEKMNGETITWMLSMAKQKNTAIMGSLVISENDRFYNRSVFASPKGEIHHYDKRHTFTLAGEDKFYTAGKSTAVFDYHGWKICPMICYDLRFPVWSRNTSMYDLLIYVANWPRPRIAAWDTLLKARAIENMCYCIGVNRVGNDENLNEYNGHSAVYDALGKQLTFNGEKENITTVALEKNMLTAQRTKFDFLADRDHFSL